MRKMLTAGVLLALIPAMLPATTFAATKIQPGLWDNTVTVNLGEGMPQIPPAVREQMKQMGMQIPGVEPTTHQTCITPEQAARETIPNISDEESGCKVAEQKREGDRFTANIVCDGRMKGQGTMTTTLNSSKSYTGKMAFKGTSAEGMPLNMSSEAVGTWKSADCGSVQPYKE
jgi:hypothetical protein